MTARRSPRFSYLLSLWRDQGDDETGKWRGCLETPSGQRLYFTRLSELIRLLSELSGWSEERTAWDAPEGHVSPKDG
jgi:hypothetical protein